MDLSPLYEALFATDDEIEQGFIDALIGAFEQRASWPNLFFMSGKGGEIFSQRTFGAIGKVLRSIEDEEAAQKLSTVSTNVGEGEVKTEPIEEGEVKCEPVGVGEVKTGFSEIGGSKEPKSVAKIGGSTQPRSVSEMGGKLGLGRGKKPKTQHRTRPNYYPKMIPRVSTTRKRRMYGFGAKITPIYDDDEKHESPLLLANLMLSLQVSE